MLGLILWLIAIIVIACFACSGFLSFLVFVVIPCGILAGVIQIWLEERNSKN